MDAWVVESGWKAIKLLCKVININGFTKTIRIGLAPLIALHCAKSLDEAEPKEQCR
jgi:hypothetical protein